MSCRRKFFVAPVCLVSWECSWTVVKTLSACLQGGIGERCVVIESRYGLRDSCENG
jgi:hypothetical protein